jgi:glucose-6-phosphate 1-dehydrogenase
MKEGEADGFVTDAQEWSDFASRVFYVPGDVSSPEGLEKLQQRLFEMEGPSGEAAYRLYYLSLAPSLYEKAINSRNRKDFQVIPNLKLYQPN